MSPQQRNGGSWAYELLFIVWCVAVVAVVGVVTVSVLSLSQRLDLSRRMLQILSSTALALVVFMTMIAAGTGIWWVNEARFAPQFLRDNIGSGVLFTSSSLPLTLAAAGVLMLVGLSSAIVGAARIVGGYRFEH